MNPTPYLTFKGDCRRAMSAYAEIFGGEIAVMMTGAEMPGMNVPDDKADWIMHSVLQLDGGQLMASDDMMGGLPPMGGCWVMMDMPARERGQEVFTALADGGEIKMEFKPTEWASGFGMLTDRFGIHWMISAPPTG